jgi:hypothetical protein
VDPFAGIGEVPDGQVAEPAGGEGAVDGRHGGSFAGVELGTCPSPMKVAGSRRLGHAERPREPTTGRGAAKSMHGSTCHVHHASKQWSVPLGHSTGCSTFV